MPKFIKMFFSIIFFVQSFAAFAHWKEQFPKIAASSEHLKQQKNIEQEIEKIWPLCLSKIESQLGKKWDRDDHGRPERLRIQVLPVDSMTHPEGNAETSGNYYITIALNSSAFIGGNADLKTTFCHEMVHAYFRYHMGGSYSSLPKWAREGIAVYLAQQFEDKERWALLEVLLKNRTVINGLEGPHHFGDYYEDALAFYFLKDRFKLDMKILIKVLDGEDIYEAIEELTKLDKEQFLLQSLSFAHLALEKKKGELSAPSLAALKVYRDQKQKMKSSNLFWAIAQEQFKQNNLGLDFALAFVALYDLFPSNTNNHEQLQFFSKIFQSVSSEVIGQTRGRLRYKMAQLLLERDEFNRSLAYYTDVFFFDNDMPILQQSATAGILRSFVGLKQWENVLKWSENEKGLDHGDLLEYRYYRGMAYSNLGQHKKAVKTLRVVCHDETGIKIKNKFQEWSCKRLAEISGL